MPIDSWREMTWVCSLTLHSLREGLAFSDDRDEPTEGLTRGLRHGLGRVGALLSSSLGPVSDRPKGTCVVNFFVAWHNAPKTPKWPEWAS